jgi:hypothetical protein
MVSTRSSQWRRLVKESEEAASEHVYTEACTRSASKTAIDILPNEILSTILRLCICEYFSTYQPLIKSPPILRVCHRWRQAAISSPECWTLLAVQIDTCSETKYTRRHVSGRETKPRAAQDTLSCYFKWARDCLVDLSIEYLPQFYQSCRTNLISNDMPQLHSSREYCELGLFLNMLPALSESRYKSLVAL